MIRNLKVLGLAVVAVCAMSAMIASAAQAAPNYWFKSDAAAGVKTTLSGEMKTRTGGLFDEFTTTSGVQKCTTATYTGSVVGPTQATVTLHPVISTVPTPCTAFGFAAIINTEGCNYVFEVGEKSGTAFPATAKIECEAGKETTITASIAGVTKCIVHIPPQDLGQVTLTNATKASGVKDIHVDLNLSGITYTETGGSGAGACATSALQNNGTYVGTATLNGKNPAGAETNIFLE